MLTYSTWNEFVLKTFGSRMETLLDISEAIATKRMKERLEEYIKDHMDKLRMDYLPLTHKEIAEDLNTSREVITRLLKKMEENGKIRNTRFSVEWIGEIPSRLK